MKYNEAIDMILDGGMYAHNNRAYRKSWHTSYDVCFFVDDLMKRTEADTSEEDDRLSYLVFTKDDLIAEDWIVEKDGVVYEEAPKRVEENRPKQPREKVTVEDMMILIDMLFLQREAASLDLMLSLGLSELERRFRMNDCKITFDTIKQKLEYLVSLQEEE